MAGDRLNEAQRRWLLTDRAAAVLTSEGTEEAYYYLLEHGGVEHGGVEHVEAVVDAGHPQAAAVVEAMRRLAASGKARPRLYQVKIALSDVRPPVWRRLLVPSSATLGCLHEVIRIVMEWDDDHLHVFACDGRRYADRCHELEGCGDEETVRLSKVLSQAGTAVTYTYDLGDCWRHTISLEKILTLDETTTYPICVAGRGEAPVEDWNPDSPEGPTIPYDNDALNRQLSALAARRWTGGGAQSSVSTY